MGTQELYETAGSIVERVCLKRGGIRNLVYAAKIPPKARGALSALVRESIRYITVIRAILKEANISELTEASDQQHVLYVLVFEHLLSKQRLRGGGQLGVLVRKYSDQLKASLAHLISKAGVGSARELLPEEIRNDTVFPRYIRVNLITSSVKEVIKQLVEDGLKLVGSLQQVGEGTFARDPVLRDVLALPPKCNLLGHRLVEDGSIVLQDRASSLSAHVVDPQPNMSVIDACAAPGNKTTHLASLMRNKGEVHAFDRSDKRLKTLIRARDKAQATCIQAQCCDFLTVKPSDPSLAKVATVLLDPSCSGSGMVGRLEDHVAEGDQEAEDQARVASLSDMQTRLVLHAMTFPQVQTVVYSTCSVHDEENEMVVSRVLEAADQAFCLETALPKWPTRGKDKYSFGKEVIRAYPASDHTNGFFVSRFKRISQKPIDIPEGLVTRYEQRQKQEQEARATGGPKRPVADKLRHPATRPSISDPAGTRRAKKLKRSAQDFASAYAAKRLEKKSNRRKKKK